MKKAVVALSGFIKGFSENLGYAFAGLFILLLVYAWRSGERFDEVVANQKVMQVTLNNIDSLKLDLGTFQKQMIALDGKIALMNQERNEIKKDLENHIYRKPINDMSFFVRHRAIYMGEHIYTNRGR
jgi:hypothetical protein